MKCNLNLVFLIGIFLPLISSRIAKFFRKDYMYVPEFDAFYKLHWDTHLLTYNSMFLTCDDEESTLFYPKSVKEWTIVKNLTEKVANAQNITEIIVGFHDQYAVGEFMTVDGRSTPSPLYINEPKNLADPADSCVLVDINTGVFRFGSCANSTEPTPFVCKKMDTESCPTIDQNYKYVRSTNKCYKVNKKPKSWTDAMRTCYNEGGILMVLENKQEADAVLEALPFERFFEYFVGARSLFPGGDCYTVKGQKCVDVYQKAYDDDAHTKECSTIYYKEVNTVHTSSLDCNTRTYFVCQMEVTV